LDEIKAFKNINFTGCPPLIEEQMREFKPSKKTVNVWLDADVIEWLQSAGRGYQTRMNAILREAMLKSGSYFPLFVIKLRYIMAILHGTHLNPTKKATRTV
jgi:hypothetical protein